jgi:hypothetical protein
MARTRHAAVGSGADAPDRGPRLRLRAKTEDPPPVAGSGRSHDVPVWAKRGHVGARHVKCARGCVLKMCCDTCLTFKPPRLVHSFIKDQALHSAGSEMLPLPRGPP